MFNVDLPISGGNGKAIDSPIIIHRVTPNDYVGIERMILKCLGIGRRVSWSILNQTLMSHNGRSIDRVQIETKETTETEIITQVENFYFDITECLFDSAQFVDTFDERATLDKIKERLSVLGESDPKVKGYLELMKSVELFADYESVSHFLDVLFADESFPLFKDMMDHGGKPMLNVLRVIGAEIK